MRPLVLVLTSSVVTGAAAFYAGRFTANSGESGAGAPGSSRVVVEQRSPVGAGVAAPLAGGGSQKAKAAAADPWASLRDRNGEIPADRMDEAIRRVMTDSNPVNALESFTALLKNLTPDNASAAWKALQSQAQGAEAMRYLPLLSYSWGAIDGPAALKALSEEGGRDNRMGSMSAIGGWAAKDPQAALAWLKEYEAANKSEGGEGGRGGRDRDGGAGMLKLGLINGLAQSDPQAALAVIATMDENERGRLVGVVAQRELKQGVESAARWATSIQDPEMRKAAMASVAGEYARQDPAQAAAWLTSAGDGTVDPGAVGSVARAWVEKDPEKALQWINTLPAGQAQNEAYEDAFRSWARIDPTASSTYLNSMPAGPSKDAAITSLVRGIVGEDPSAAVQWASTISDEKARMETLVRAAQEWNRQDSASAQAWIASSGLPATVQQQILTQAGRGGGRERGGFDRGGAGFDRRGGGGPGGFGGGPGGGFGRGGFGGGRGGRGG